MIRGNNDTMHHLQCLFGIWPARLMSHQSQRFPCWWNGKTHRLNNNPETN